jgi:hypothetical protein
MRCPDIVMVIGLDLSRSPDDRATINHPRLRERVNVPYYCSSQREALGVGRRLSSCRVLGLSDNLKCRP